MAKNRSSSKMNNFHLFLKVLRIVLTAKLLLNLPRSRNKTKNKNIIEMELNCEKGIILSVPSRNIVYEIRVIPIILEKIYPRS
jgi:hypothetical protein